MITAVWSKTHTHNIKEWGTNMGGGILSRLFSRAATNSGDDVLRNVATKYGGNIASQYGDDVAKPIISQLVGGVDQEVGRVLPVRKSAIGDALVRASDTGLNAPLNLTRKGMREVGKDAKQKIGMLYDRTGISSMDKLRSLGKELTGGDKSFMDEVTNYMQTNGARGNYVDLSDVAPTIRDLKDNLPKAIQNAVDEKDPAKLSNFFRSAASDLRKSPTPKAGDKELAAMYERMGREINNRVDAGIDPKYVSQAFNDTINEFTVRSRRELLAGDKGKSEAYKRLAKELADIPPAERTVQRYRSFKKDFVDVSRMGELSDQATGGGAISRAVKQVPVVGPMLDATLASPVEAGAQKAGEGMRGLGRKFQTGEAQKTLKTVAGVGGGLAILNGLTNGGGEPEPAGDPMMMGMAGMDGQDQTSSRMAGGAGAAADTEAEPTVAGYTQSQLENAYVAALMDDNVDAAEAIGGMLDMIDNKQARTDKMTTSAAKTKGAAQAENAATMMSKLNTLYEAGGGAQGVGGALSGLLNKATFGALNPNQAAYEDMLQAAAVAVARANGEVGVLSNQDIENYRKMLPTFSDNPKQAQLKLQTIMSGLQGME